MDRHGSNWPKERRVNVSGFFSDYQLKNTKKIATFILLFTVCYIHKHLFVTLLSLSPSNGEGIWQSLSGGPVAGGPVPELRGGGGGTPS